MTWKPDPTFYPSPRMASKAAPETLAYVAAFDPNRKTPDAIAVVDIDPKSKSYSKIISTTPMPNAGDELHHFGWNACSSCLCPNAPHPHVERRYLVVADLVVDASGRGALTIALLQSIGRPLPEETTIGIDLGYATCVFAIPDDAPADWKGVMTFGQAPDDSRGGLMLPLEGNRWMATIGGRHGDVPSGDAEGFLTYARALRTPTIYNAISRARRLDGVARYGFPESVRRHFERLGTSPRASADRRRHLPLQSGLRPGMSVAALEACLLRRLLERPGDGDPIAGLAPAFFAEVQALIETPWSVAVLDFVFPDTRGQRPAEFETTLQFGIALTRLAAEDPAVHKLTAEVQNLLKPRSVYRDPKLVARVLTKMAEA